MFQAIKNYLISQNMIGVPCVSKAGNVSVVIPNFSQDGETDYYLGKNPNDILAELKPLIPDNYIVEVLPQNYQYKGTSLILREASNITEFAFDALEDDAEKKKAKAVK